MDDRAIIDAFFKRDEEAIAHTQRKYGKLMFSVAFNLLKSEEDANECVNDALLSAWNSIPPNDPKHFSAYLVTLARRRAFDLLDRRTASKRVVDADVSEEFLEMIPSRYDTEGEFEYRRINKIINDYLRKQKESDRRLFILRYFCSESLKDASVKVGLSESAAKSRLMRMRNALKENLEKEDVFI